MVPVVAADEDFYVFVVIIFLVVKHGRGLVVVVL